MLIQISIINKSVCKIHILSEFASFRILGGFWASKRVKRFLGISATVMKLFGIVKLYLCQFCTLTDNDLTGLV